MSGKHILVVDDDPDTLTLLVLTLRQAGYQVTKAASGQVAVAHAKERAYDLVLLDLMMPGMSGFDVLRALRVAPGPMPAVIMLTAKSSFQDQVTARELGALEYLVKPVARDELLRKVKEVLSRPREDGDGYAFR